MRAHLLDAASHRYRDSGIFSGVVKASVPSLVEVDLPVATGQAIPAAIEDPSASQSLRHSDHGAYNPGPDSLPGRPVPIADFCALDARRSSLIGPAHNASFGA